MKQITRWRGRRRGRGRRHWRRRRRRYRWWWWFWSWLPNWRRSGTMRAMWNSVNNRCRIA